MDQLPIEVLQRMIPYLGHAESETDVAVSNATAARPRFSFQSVISDPRVDHGDARDPEEEERDGGPLCWTHDADQIRRLFRLRRLSRLFRRLFNLLFDCLVWKTPRQPRKGESVLVGAGPLTWVKDEFGFLFKQNKRTRYRDPHLDFCPPSDFRLSLCDKLSLFKHPWRGFPGGGESSHLSSADDPRVRTCKASAKAAAKAAAVAMTTANEVANKVADVVAKIWLQVGRHQTRQQLREKQRRRRKRQQRKQRGNLKT